MGSDVEVRERSRTSPAALSVREEALPGEECRLVRQGSRRYRSGGNASSSSSTRSNPTDTSAKTMGLMTRIDSSAARASASDDHVLHLGSFVATSRMTWLSTSIAITRGA
jgi:hypothetical protein